MKHLLIILSFLLISSPLQAQFQPSGVVKLVDGYGIIIRNGSDIKIQKKETIIKNGDLIRIAIAIMSLFYSVILKGVCMHRASKIEQFIK